MIKKKQLFFFIAIYVCVLFIETYAIAISSINLQQVVKPAFTVVLLLMYFKISLKLNLWFVVTLILYATGDYLFIFNEKQIFLQSSILIFNVTFISYAILAFKQQPKQSETVLFSAFTAFFLSIGLVFYVLSERLESFFLTAFFHTIILSILVVVAFSSYIHKCSRQNLLLFIGVFLFGISDCLFLIYRFYDTRLLYSIVAIDLYALGQLGVCLFMTVAGQKELLYYK